ncbi:hypothetical protein [Escherichia coli]|jgi:hypothetical protein|uniref:hypothetical protein n=1 Tax=Escherichia coli TaxID=562 RepID=UPI0013E2F040|nr:hypothetical protein [Escherichia coli]QRX68226.1 hypothetical protein JS511_02945 [Escherichia coli]WQC24654.1 hypothetical protein U0530_21585 [Escherichia coli]HBH9565969.1 hypothetical protein [Escherichia coli]HBP4082627.1 hypothetical protein [Escherichia coli]HBP4699200.1 hypothetical protein [Escherichia coli]
MDKQIVQYIMKFMARVDLKGAEVPAYVHSMDALQAELDRTDNVSQEVNNGTEE